LFVPVVVALDSLFRDVIVPSNGEGAGSSRRLDDLLVGLAIEVSVVCHILTAHVILLGDNNVYRLIIRPFPDNFIMKD
jgi:hypothetical protein